MIEDVSVLAADADDWNWNAVVVAAAIRLLKVIKDVVAPKATAVVVDINNAVFDLIIY